VRREKHWNLDWASRSGKLGHVKNQDTKGTFSVNGKLEAIFMKAQVKDLPQEC
jgi:hypothetical protein